MFRRKENSSLPVILPKEWTDQFKQTLLKIYGEQCLKDDKTFEIYAYTYPDEVLLIVSYLGLDSNEIPLTLFLSTDLKEQTKSVQALDTLCDSVGIFFDQYFGQLKAEAQKDSSDFYVYEWEEEKINQMNIYYKLTRENIHLTIEANKLLGEF